MTKRGASAAWAVVIAVVVLIYAGSAWAGSVTDIPEPGSLALLAMALGALIVYRARGRK